MILGRKFFAASALLLAAAIANASGNGQIIVKFAPGGLQPFAAAAVSAVDAVPVGLPASPGAMVLEVRGHRTPESAASILAGVPGVLWAEPNYRVGAFADPNDPLFTSEWALPKIHAPQAWEQTRGDSGVVVAVIDTGVDLSHPDLVNQLVSGFDFVDYDSTPQDMNGHGTHCAGTIVALQNNSQGIAGLAPMSRVMPVRVLGADGSGTVSDVAAGMTYAVDHGAKILSLSLGSTADSSALRDAVTYAHDHGVLVVCAAGNAGNVAKTYPAAIPGVLSVAATDPNDRRASFSSYGPAWVMVAAPGTNIVSLLPGGRYGTASGTSMATPFVAATAALVTASMGLDTSPDTVMERIEKTATYVGDFVKYGRIDAFNALSEPANSGLQLTNDAEIAGGTLLRIRVALPNPAPAGGTALTGVLSNPSLGSVAAGQKINAGLRSGWLVVKTKGVVANADLTVAVTAGSLQGNAQVKILAPQIASMRFGRAQIAGGKKVVLLINLTSPLVAKTTLSLVSSNTGVISDANVELKAGTRIISLLVSTKAVSSPTKVQLSATMAERTRTAEINVVPSGS